MPPKKKSPVPCPNLHPLPDKAQARLIDKGILHCLASQGGARERYGKGKTPHTIHVWWARRPFSAMRTLVFASLDSGESPKALSLASELGRLPVSASKDAKAAAKMLSRQYAEPPRVLDMFGGGGAIALEAGNLGCRAFSLDSNPLAVFIQKSLMEFIQEAGGCPPDLLKESGRRVLERLERETAPLFPMRNSQKGPVLAYFYTYETACPHCGWKFFLSRRPWLSRKKGREACLEFHPGEDHANWKIIHPSRDHKPTSLWRKTGAVCPVCGKVCGSPVFSQCREVLTALCRRGNGKGKDFEAGSPKVLAEPALIEKMESAVLAYLGQELPKTKIPKWSGIFNPAIYGMDSHADFLNPRQRLVLLLLIKSLRTEYDALTQSESKAVARCVIGLLSGLVDQLIDWNSRLSMWIPQNEQAGRAFCGPGVPMMWDYVEIDPLLNGPANLWKKLDRIVEGAKAIPTFSMAPDVRLAAAQNLPFGDGIFDAIVTDPPYYDNIFYSPLADFFYSWKKMVISALSSELAGFDSTESPRELVASVRRHNSKLGAHESYCRELTQALCEGARVLKDSGLMSLIYSHSSLNGWDALVKAFRASPLLIASVQPLCIERKARPRGLASGAVNTCLVLVARKSSKPKPVQSPSELAARFEDIAGCGFARDLLNQGWPEEDAGLALFSQGAALLANSSGELIGNDHEVLALIESVVASRLPGFKISRRRSL
ncbi:DUF1156 domain-containing protein [Desulfatibacillum aliphaticivorans]|uniref:DUF1156 domain-containing protein n=1 Tax=Desulfatibacillum aliphaticivorans TaxID=218208 RepID=UPI000401778F|nr:DUF1156 domain-containing protein [Desulfatibacillum aliphaticivorans]